MKLTENQEYYLNHISKHGMTSEHRIAKQLEKKGLIVIDPTKYERVEWDKVVARLTTAFLTESGKTVLSLINYHYH